VKVEILFVINTCSDFRRTIKPVEVIFGGKSEQQQYV